MLPLHRVSTHPGQVLFKEFLEPLELSQVKLAQALNIPQNRVNELIRGKPGITPETALLLAEYFKNSAEFWMNLQTAYDLTERVLSYGNVLYRRQEVVPGQPAEGYRVPAWLSLPQWRSPPHRLR